MSWTFALAPSSQSRANLNRVALKKVRLILKEKKSGGLQSLAFHDPKQTTQRVHNFALYDGKNQISLVIPPITELSPGSYSVVGVEALIQNKDGIFVPFQIPFPNPHPGSSPDIWTIGIHKGQVALGGRFVLRTNFKISESNEGQTQTEIQALDTLALPSHIALEFLNQSPLLFDRVISGNPHVHRIRVPLTDKKGLPLNSQGGGQIGFLVKGQCAPEQAFMTLWKRQGDERDYLSVLPMWDCAPTGTWSQTIGLPSGHWTLKGASVLTKPFTAPDTWWVQDNASQLKAFFDLDDIRSSPGDTLKEKDLLKPLFVHIPETSPSSITSLGFLGTFEIRKRNANEWNIVQLPSFRLEEVQNNFQGRKILNGYTQEPLLYQRPQGIIETTVRLAVGNENQGKHTTFASELRLLGTHTFAECIKDQEKKDPLASAQATVGFYFVKGSNSLTVKSISSDQKSFSSEAISKCLEKNLFLKKLPKVAPFTGGGELIIKTG